MERSKALLASLGDERERWDAGSETFKSQMATISGDVLLTSAFMAYGGFYDQQLRQSLFTSWLNHLGQANISFRQDLARVEVCVYVSGSVCGCVCMWVGEYVGVCVYVGG